VECRTLPRSARRAVLRPSTVTGPGGGEFVPVRRWLAVLLAALLGVMLMLDIVIADYHVDPVVTGSILGTIIALVGIDAGKRIGGGPA
jgi:hypothetical protein